MLSRIDKIPNSSRFSPGDRGRHCTSMGAAAGLAQAAAAALEDDQKVEPASLIVATLPVNLSPHIHALVWLAKAAKSTGPGRDPATRGDEGE